MSESEQGIDLNHDGELLLVQKGTIAQRKASTRNRKFALIGLTLSFTGEPIMCVIIIEGKLLNGAIEAGVNIHVQPNGKLTNKDFIVKNSGKG